MTREEFLKALINSANFDLLISGKFTGNTEIYNVKVGDGKYCCSISAYDIKALEEVDICFNADKTYFYIIDADYKAKLNADNTEFVGEFKSKFNSKDEISDFGFGHKASGLTKYKTKDFKN